jgi:RNA polymerase sporulation-specific sigma factor
MRSGVTNDPYQAFENMTDEEVVMAAKQDENLLAQEYLLYKYRNFVRAKARSYFLIGAEREDIIQEGMIGLFKAIRDFRNDKLSSFRAFAELCVTRQIITAIKTATRQKHIPLNSYVSLNKPIYEEDSDRTLLDVISGAKVANPEEMVISREEFLDIENKMNNILSDLEWKVLMSYLDGKSYQEIAVDLDRHIKSIDNALQRVKRKLEKYLNSRAEGTDLKNVYCGLMAMDPSERFGSHRKNDK